MCSDFVFFYTCLLVLFELSTAHKTLLSPLGFVIVVGTCILTCR